jgi:hypothetical protein
MEDAHSKTTYGCFPVAHVSGQAKKGGVDELQDLGADGNVLLYDLRDLVDGGGRTSEGEI